MVGFDEGLKMTSAMFISMAANVALVLAMVVVYRRAKRKIIEEKLATFGGCVAAISLGLWREGHKEQVQAIADGLTRMRPGMDKTEIALRISRATLIRMLRSDTAYDVIGETVHARAKDLFQQTAENEGITDYVVTIFDTKDISRGEPRALYGDDGLCKAQIQQEQTLLTMYRATFSGLVVNPLAG